MVPEHVVSAFDMMWGLFPEPVMLVHQNRTILATNGIARDMGIPNGIKCHQLNPDAGGNHCGACKANLALKTGKAVVENSEQSGICIQGFWVPVKGELELYVHFGIGMKAVAEAAAIGNVSTVHS